MYNLFADHDSFLKTKRALLVSSVVLFLISDISFASQSINFLELEININQERLVFLHGLLVLYFFYNFVLRARHNLSRLRVEESLNAIETRQNEIVEAAMAAIGERQSYAETMGLSVDQHADDIGAIARAVNQLDEADTENSLSLTDQLSDDAQRKLQGANLLTQAVSRWRLDIKRLSKRIKKDQTLAERAIAAAFNDIFKDEVSEIRSLRLFIDYIPAPTIAFLSLFFSGFWTIAWSELSRFGG